MSRGWEERFRIVDKALQARLARAPELAAPVAWAWQRLEASGGAAAIAPLAAAAGWSQKHLIERFRRHLGMAPKRLARILRFARFAERLQKARHVRWIDLALDSG